MTADWPVADRSYVDDDAEARMESLQSVVTQVRRFRADQGLKPSQSVAARLGGLGEAGLADYEPLIRSLVRLDEPAVVTMSGQTGEGIIAKPGH